MTDAAIGGAPAELEPSAPAPEAAATSAGAESVDHQESAALADDGLRYGAANPEPPAPEPALTDHPLGSLRQRILDHLVDTADAGPQSVADILQAMPAGTTRNTIEGAIRRAHAAGEIERVAAGQYVLGKAKPVEQPKPASSPEPKPQPDVDQAREAALARDAERKREARRRDAEAAMERARAADQQLRDRLLEACRHGKHDGSTKELVAADLWPIRALLQLGVPLDHIALAVYWRSENDRLVTWRDQRLLEKAWYFFGRLEIIPHLMKANGKAAPKPVERAESELSPEAKDAPVASPAEPEAIPGEELGELDQAARGR